jgi:hypothetical protein
MNPSNLPTTTPKTHFSGLSFHRYRLRLLKTSYKFSMKFSEFSVLITTVAELPELFQLKCLSHALEARPHLNGNNPSIPRI